MLRPRGGLHTRLHGRHCAAWCRPGVRGCREQYAPGWDMDQTVSARPAVKAAARKAAPRVVSLQRLHSRIVEGGPCSRPRSALGARRSALGARRSALGARRSALGARHCTPSRSVLQYQPFIGATDGHRQLSANRYRIAAVPVARSDADRNPALGAIGLGVRRQWRDGASALGARRSAHRNTCSAKTRRSALGARRFGARPLALGARPKQRHRRSALGARRSALGARAWRSALGARRSALGVRRSASPTASALYTQPKRSAISTLYRCRYRRPYIQLSC